MSKRTHAHSDFVSVRSPADQANVGLFVDVPNIQTPVVSAPGSETSRLIAESIDGPFRRRSWRLVMLALAASSHPLSREALSERTGIKEASLCARLAELRPDWIEALSGACTSHAGVTVDGYLLTPRGAARVRQSGEAA